MDGTKKKLIDSVIRLSDCCITEPLTSNKFTVNFYSIESY